MFAYHVVCIWFDVCMSHTHTHDHTCFTKTKNQPTSQLEEAAPRLCTLLIKTVWQDQASASSRFAEAASGKLAAVEDSIDTWSWMKLCVPLIIAHVGPDICDSGKYGMNNWKAWQKFWNYKGKTQGIKLGSGVCLLLLTGKNIRSYCWGHISPQCRKGFCLECSEPSFRSLHFEQN